MTQHYTKLTVEAQHYCNKCGRMTMHRVDDGRLGPCLECIKKLDQVHEQRLKLLGHPKPPKQGKLF